MCGSVNWNVAEVNSLPVDGDNCRDTKIQETLPNTLRTNNKIESHSTNTGRMKISHYFHENNKLMFQIDRMQNITTFTFITQPALHNNF